MIPSAEYVIILSSPQTLKLNEKTYYHVRTVQQFLVDPPACLSMCVGKCHRLFIYVLDRYETHPQLNSHLQSPNDKQRKKMCGNTSCLALAGFFFFFFCCLSFCFSNLQPPHLASKSDRTEEHPFTSFRFVSFPIQLLYSLPSTFHASQPIYCFLFVVSLYFFLCLL